MQFNPTLTHDFLSDTLLLELRLSGVEVPADLRTILENCTVSKCPKCGVLKSQFETEAIPEDKCGECFRLDQSKAKAKKHE